MAITTAMTRNRPSRRGLDRWLLNIGAVLGSLCLVLAALALAFGLKPLIFTSGSMGPAIPTGSLAMAVTVPASEVSPGEVVSVITHDDVRLTHRVVSANPSEGLMLKGDANAVVDLHPYTGKSVERVLFSFPGLGYLASWLASPWVFLSGGLLCAYLMYVAFFRRATGPDGPAPDAGAEKSGARHRTWLGLGAVVTVLALVVTLGNVNRVEATQAAWTASAAASSAPSAWIVPKLTGVSCAQDPVDKQVVRFTWTPVPGSPAIDKISVTAKKGAGLLTPENSKTVTLLPSTTTLEMGPQSAVDLISGLLNLLLPQDFTVTFTTQKQFGQLWVSETVEFAGVRYSPGVAGLLGSRMTCPAVPSSG